MTNIGCDLNDGYDVCRTIGGVCVEEIKESSTGSRSKVTCVCAIPDTEIQVTPTAPPPVTGLPTVPGVVVTPTAPPAGRPGDLPTPPGIGVPTGPVGTAITTTDSTGTMTGMMWLILLLLVILVAIWGYNERDKLIPLLPPKMRRKAEEIEHKIEAKVEGIEKEAVHLEHEVEDKIKSVAKRDKKRFGKAVKKLEQEAKHLEAEAFGFVVKKRKKAKQGRKRKKK